MTYGNVSWELHSPVLTPEAALLSANCIPQIMHPFVFQAKSFLHFLLHLIKTFVLFLWTLMPYILLIPYSKTDLAGAPLVSLVIWFKVS